MKRKRIVILGAAGRDFHNFNTLYREDEGVEVVAFTAAQIPDIEGRSYPPELAGRLYPDGIPIRGEGELESIIQDESVDEAVFSYSDVSHEYVMQMASRVNTWGADFKLCSAASTMLESSKPVIAVTAVRTGCRKVADHALPLSDSAGARQEGRCDSASHAVRRSLTSDLSALRHL